MMLRSTVILLALTTTSPVFAQSGITLSGYIDMGLYYDYDKTWKAGSVSRNSIELSGREDLGNGLTALFKLQNRFEANTGTLEDGPASGKPLWHGESTIGLEGSFGKIRFGRALDVISQNDSPYDPFENFDRISSTAWHLWHTQFPSDPKANSGKPDYGRLNNGLFYDSPRYNGFALHLSYSPTQRDRDRNRPIGIAIDYTSAAMSIMGAHAKNSAGDTDTFIGLRGNWGNFSLMGAYDVSKQKLTSIKAKALTVGAEYRIDKTTLKAGLGRLRVDGRKATDMASLGATYAMSKRTTLYLDFGHKRPVGLKSQSAYGAGIRHSF